MQISFCDKPELTDLQKRIHRSGNLATSFRPDYDNTLWNTSVIAPFEHTSTGDQSLYTFPIKSGHIIGTYIEVKIPTIKVADKSKFRIRLCHNFIHYVVNEATLLINGSLRQSFNTYILDTMLHCFRFPGMKKHLSHNIGNNGTFEHTIQEDILMYEINCIYKYNGMDLSKIKDLKFSMKNCLQLDKLIEIMDNDGNNIPFDWSHFDTDCPKVLPEPTLWGVYCKTDPEINESPSSDFWYDDFIFRPCDSELIVGSLFREIPIDSADPVKGIIVLIEDANKRDVYNITSDYSIGESSKLSFIKSKNHVFRDVPAIHFTRINACRFQSIPFEPGYIAIPLSATPCSRDVDPGICFTSGDRIGVQTKYPGLNDRFRIYTILYVSRQFSYSESE
jgi:hypothetical protein